MLKTHRSLLAKLLLFAIVGVGALLRLYKLNTPLADWHSWRQADTVSVAVEYQKHGIDLLHPKYLDLSSIPSGLDNPEGYRMVEFPLIPALVSRIPSPLPIHVTYRLVNIVLSLFSIVFLYSLVQALSTRRLALMAAFVFAFLPYNVFYSRTALPEIALVTFSLAALYCFVAYLKRPTWLLAIGYMLCAATALLLKPTAAFFFLPLVVLLIREKGIKEIFKLKWLATCCLLLTPLILWRFWIGHYPAGIPAFTWLLNGNGIRFKGAFFHWLFGVRLGDLILGYWGLLPFGLGIMSLQKPAYRILHTTYFMYSWLLSMLAYLCIFATGNVQHDYYQIILIPVISIFVALGFDYLISQKTLTAYCVLLTTLAFMFAFSWYSVRGYYNINNPTMVTAGQAVDRLTPPEALVIAPYQGDTAFLYQTNRRGWPIGGDIEAKIHKGAQYYVTTTRDDEANALVANYTLISETPDYLIIKLSK